MLSSFFLVAAIWGMRAGELPARAANEAPAIVVTPSPLNPAIGPPAPTVSSPPSLGSSPSQWIPQGAPSLPATSSIVQPPQVVRAKPTDPAEYADLSPEQPRPIDVAQERLHRLFRNRRAHELKRAYDAINDRQYGLARKLSAPFLKDPLFLDYGISFLAQALRGEARLALQAKNLDQAQALAEKSIAQLLRLETEDPYSPFLKTEPRDLAMDELVIADANWERKRWPAALAYYEKAFQRLSTVGTFEELRPDTLAHYAEACTKKTSDLCRPWIQRFNALYPKGSVEIRSISHFFRDIDDMERAPRPVSKVTQPYKAPDLDQAAFDAAMALYFDAKYKDSIPKLQQFIDEFPRSSYRFRARYWLAQALTLQQDHDKAQKEFENLCKESPLTWYGLLAAISSGRDIDGAIDGTLPLVAETDAFLQAGEARRLKRAQYFVVEGAFDLAALELRDLKIRDSLSSPFLMYLAMLNSEAQNYNNTFVILSALIQRAYEGVYSSYTMRLVFPSPYMELIRKYAAAEGLDPLLVLSLIKQESAFNAGAGSSVGAVGLMQLMPLTAVEVNPDITRADLLAADVNIQTGARYLKRLLTRFNGNVVLALSAYNAGPAAADRWLKDSPPNRGMLEFIEAIPYRETREYVGSIIRNYYWYSKRLNGDVPRNLAHFWNIYGPPSSQPGLVDKK